MILIVDMNHKKDSLAFSEFILPIISVAKKTDTCIAKHYSDINQKEIEKYSKIILSGTALKDNTYLKDADKLAWLKKTNTPVLGICAGMQIISAVFGSDTKKCMEIGMTEIETVKKNPLFTGNFSAYELHNWTVDIPSNFCILAKSKKCAQAIKHKKKDIYGILFHPEVRNREIIGRFAQS